MASRAQVPVRELRKAGAMHCACLSKVITIDLAYGVVRTPYAETERFVILYTQVDGAGGMFGRWAMAARSIFARWVCVGLCETSILWGDWQLNRPISSTAEQNAITPCRASFCFLNRITVSDDRSSGLLWPACLLPACLKCTCI